MDEYESLKKLEDKWQDTITELDQKYQEEFKTKINTVLDDTEYKVVYFKIKSAITEAPLCIARRMSKEEYNKFSERITEVGELPKSDFKNLIDRVIGKNPFKNLKLWE
jgi:hypothetical protein